MSSLHCFDVLIAKDAVGRSLDFSSHTAKAGLTVVRLTFGVFNNSNFSW
jgi:hypothetical protein